jgi:predicted small secreted protein
MLAQPFAYECVKPHEKTVRRDHVFVHDRAIRSYISLEKARHMHRTFRIGLTLLAVVVAAPLLGACHTTAGAGEDVSATGHAVTRAATQATP